MAPVVVGAGIAVAVAKEARERLVRAKFERAAEDVDGRLRTHVRDDVTGSAGRKVARACRLDKGRYGRTLKP